MNKRNVLDRLRFLLVPLIFLSFLGSATAATVKSDFGPNICLEVPGGIPVPAKLLQLGTCNSTDSQKFLFQEDGQIRFGPLCVDAYGGLGRNGDAIMLWYCHGYANQIWKRTVKGEITGINGKCIDVSGPSVVLWSCGDAPGQKWVISDEDCFVKRVDASAQEGLMVWSPDRTQYLVNREDSNGVGQIYVGRKDGGAPVCITCTDKPNGPKASKFKMQPHWHPSGKWIILAVEQEKINGPLFTPRWVIEGWLQCGLWTDMYAATPDGSAWFKLQDFRPPNKATGFTGVAFTPDGGKGVWAQIVDGNVFAYSFGKWELIIADFQEVNGVPSWTNLRNITPPDTYWLEPGNFSPNGKDLLLTADYGFPDHSKVEGQDQYILDIYSGRMTNLTQTPNIWDEHGVFSPDGEKIFFMSSYPYRSDPNASKTFGLKTEFMIMDKDGSNLRQLTHFNEPGFPEFSFWGSVAANGQWNPDGTSINALNLFFPKYKTWEIKFEGNCGGRRP